VEVLESATELKVGRAVELGSAPLTWFPDANGTVLIVTRHALLGLKSDLSLEHLLDAHWALLYPNNLTRSRDGMLYVGMRGGLAKLTSIDGKLREEWLLPRH
jgi:hypothetical protein